MKNRSDKNQSVNFDHTQADITLVRYVERIAELWQPAG